MLPREDGGSVDARLKVYGTGNVRVVGTFASSFPSSMSVLAHCSVRASDLFSLSCHQILRSSLYKSVLT